LPDINSKFELDQLVWRREDIKTTALKLANNHVIGFSTYLWNKNYNYELAKEIKSLNPDVLLVFGGPEVDHTNPKIFDQCPFMDVVIINEGELAFADILKAYPSVDLFHVPGLLINQNCQPLFTDGPKRLDNLDILPSPYTAGVFDQLIYDHPDVEWTATIETNRGCPFQCTFCDWGGLTYSKIKKFPLDKVFSELEWVGKNCAYVAFADANIGIFPERDGLWIDKFIEVVKKYKKIY
jgi:radical SAM superfamily enzyme YgiQ (UPF0313 family)